MSFWAPCTISLTCNLDINGNANKQRMKPFGASTLFLFVQNQESTEAVWSCPKRLIKISNCDDWAMKEACDHLGAASTPKMGWSAPPKRITDIGSSLFSSARLVYIHKTPVGNFSQGWWWLSWVHQITATAADQTNYANICSAPAQLYFDLETFSSFFLRRGICIGRKISDERQVQARAKSNFRSDKKAQGSGGKICCHSIYFVSKPIFHK